MRSYGTRLGRRALTVGCGAVMAFAVTGCTGKDAAATKPAAGEYYSGQMDKKAAPSGAGTGAGRMSINSAPAKP